MTVELCVACSGDVHSRYSNSEKPTSPISFACGHELCGNCARKKSLTSACILCQSAHDLLGTSNSSKCKSRFASSSRQRAPPSYAPTRESTEGDGFVLGDDSDDEREFGRDSPPPPLCSDSDAPPAYHDAPSERDGPVDTKGSTTCNLHYIRPEETLVGLSMKYRVEGSVLCAMNRLPISTLSTTPHLLHTLPFLVLPPTAARSTSTTPLLAPFEERKRLVIRRFQVQTRCADYGVAKAYVDAVFAKRRQEAEFVRLNRDARNGPPPASSSSYSSSLSTTTHVDGQVDESFAREGGELEEAKEQYLADERWEREQTENRRAGKRNGVSLGSKLRSTGEVESDRLSRR